jgi:hypothetical protein
VLKCSARRRRRTPNRPESSGEARRSGRSRHSPQALPEPLQLARNRPHEVVEDIVGVGAIAKIAGFGVAVVVDADVVIFGGSSAVDLVAKIVERALVCVLELAQRIAGGSFAPPVQRAAPLAVDAQEVELLPDARRVRRESGEWPRAALDAFDSGALCRRIGSDNVVVVRNFLVVGHG